MKEEGGSGFSKIIKSIKEQFNKTPPSSSSKL